MSYGSLQNRVAANSTSPEPVVGGGATVLYWTDRVAGTVVEVSPSGATVKVQYDEVTYSADGYAVEGGIRPNPEGVVLTFTRRRSGKYVLKGDSQRGGLSVIFGVRRPYYDRSF